MKSKDDHGRTIYICPCCKVTYVEVNIEKYREHLVNITDDLLMELAMLPVVKVKDV